MFHTSLPKTILRLLAVLILLGMTAWFFWQYRQTKARLDLLTNPATQAVTAQKERQDLLEKVGKLMVLPTGEDPLILDVQQASALAARQPFFRNASDGDKVLIYVQAGTGILYSPSKNVVVNVGALTVQNAQPAATESSPTTGKP